VSASCDSRAICVLTFLLRNNEIQKRIMLLPECVAPRPERRVNFCLPCVKRLKSNATHKLPCYELCKRDNAYSKCSQCRTGNNNHNCDDIPSEFNRAVNILVYLQMVSKVPGLSDVDKKRKEDRVRNYAAKFVDAVSAWSNARKAAIKKNKNWLEERRRSYDENMRRVREGLGTVGELTPRNEIVDDELEMSLCDIWKTENQWWLLRATWYGAVP
jgi:hypothetical protein